MVEATSLMLHGFNHRVVNSDNNEVSSPLLWESTPAFRVKEKVVRVNLSTTSHMCHHS